MIQAGRWSNGTDGRRVALLFASYDDCDCELLGRELLGCELLGCELLGCDCGLRGRTGTGGLTCSIMSSTLSGFLQKEASDLRRHSRAGFCSWLRSPPAAAATTVCQHWRMYSGVKNHLRSMFQLLLATLFWIASALRIFAAIALLGMFRASFDAKRISRIIAYMLPCCLTRAGISLLVRRPCAVFGDAGFCGVGDGASATK